MIEVDECTNVSLIAEDGSEITVTMRTNGRGEFAVSIFIDDGLNSCHIEIPRMIFDRFISEMRTLQ